MLGLLSPVDSGTHVVLVPSTRDVHHWPVFPQLPMTGQAPENVLLVGNPFTFQCQGVTFGVMTTDVLRHLSAQEIQRGNAGADRLSSLGSHLIGQKRWACPLPDRLSGYMIESIHGRTHALYI